MRAPLTRLAVRALRTPTCPRLPASRCLSTTSVRLADDLTMTERLRRKIWGTEKVPGSADPYTQRAATEEKDPHEELLKDYKPAVDGRGLPIVGLEEELGVWEVDSFPSQTKLTDPLELQRALHRATVETLTLIANNKLTEESFTFSTPTEDLGLTDAVTYSIDANGNIQLKFPTPETEAAILASLPTESQVEAAAAVETPAEPAIEETTTETPAETAETSEAAPEPMPKPVAATPASIPSTQRVTPAIDLSLPLTPTLLFPLYKRLLHLTGHSLPDALLTRARILSDLYTPLLSKPRPRKLAEELAPLVADIPNVKLWGKKRVGLEKELEIGRARKVDRKEEYVYEGIERGRMVNVEKPFGGVVRWGEMAETGDEVEGRV